MRGSVLGALNPRPKFPNTKNKVNNLLDDKEFAATLNNCPNLKDKSIVTVYVQSSAYGLLCYLHITRRPLTQFILKFEAFKILILKPIILIKNKLIVVYEINMNQGYFMVSIQNNLAV